MTAAAALPPVAMTTRKAAKIPTAPLMPMPSVRVREVAQPWSCAVKLRTLAEVVQAQERANQQQMLERALLGHGQFAERFQPVP